MLIIKGKFMDKTFISRRSAIVGTAALIGSAIISPLARSDTKKTVTTFNDLGSLTAAVGDIVTILGHTIRYVGSGDFIAKAGSVISDNGGQVNSATVGVYWERTNFGDFLTPWEFGVLPDSYPQTNTSEKIQNAINFCSRARIPLTLLPQKYEITLRPIVEGSDVSYGISLPSNFTLKFKRDPQAPNDPERGARFVLTGTPVPNYEIVRINNVSNVFVEYAYIDGQKDVMRDTQACPVVQLPDTKYNCENAMGIAIRCSHSITLSNPITNNCFTDGIYIAGSGECFDSGYCENILIDNHWAKACGRQGMSIISIKNSTIRNSILEGIAGMLPSAGIDIEPNTPYQYIENLNIVNPTTKNCAGAGIQIDLDHFCDIFKPDPLEPNCGSRPPVQSKNVSITIDNHYDLGSRSGVSCVHSRSGDATLALSGKIELNNCSWNSNICNGLSVEEWEGRSDVDVTGNIAPTYGVQIKVKSPIVTDPNHGDFKPNTNIRVPFANPVWGSAFSVYRVNKTDTFPIGNVCITNATVLSPGNMCKVYIFEDRNNNGNEMNNAFIDPIDVPADYLNVMNVGKISNINKVGYWHTTCSENLHPENVGLGVLSPARGSLPSGYNATTFSLCPQYFLANGPDIYIQCLDDAYGLVVRPSYDVGGPNQALGTFEGYEQATGILLDQSTHFTNPGSYLRIKPLGGSKFRILEKVGGWKFV